MSEEKNEKWYDGLSFQEIADKLHFVENGEEINAAKFFESVMSLGIEGMCQSIIAICEFNHIGNAINLNKENPNAHNVIPAINLVIELKNELLEAKKLKKIEIEKNALEIED